MTRPGGGVEQGGLDLLGPLAFPEGDGQAPGDAGLDLGLGTGLRGDLLDQRLECVGHLVLDHQMLHGGEAVRQRVARGAGLALLGDGTARAGAVAAGGLDLGGGAGCGHGGGVRSMVIACHENSIGLKLILSD